MDIDEFLDRELGELGLTDNAEKNEGDSSQQPKVAGDGSLFDFTKDQLTKANLEQAEQSYNNLWRALMQQKLKWDKDIYEQLLSLGRKFSSMLALAYDEVKNKSVRVNELINRARGYLKEGKKDIALKTYSEIQEISNSVPSIFFEEKRILQDQVAAFYRDMSVAADAELSQKISSMLREISQMVARIDGLIMSNDIESASSAYFKCIELYNQVPEGFLMGKNSLGMGLLNAYKRLSISLEISRLQDQLGRQKQFNQAPKILPKASTYYPQPFSPNQPQPAAIKKPFTTPIQQKDIMVNRKREHAKKNIKKGFYIEASREIEEALQIDPNDIESKALRAQLKTLQ